jgi:ubiquinone/menaquinone biosynthesis C-methylase UbiE
VQEIDRQFTGSIPELYDRYLVPLIFEHYAVDLARRFADLGAKRVLETAVGTGVVTRALRAALPPGAEIVATDLNQAMLDRAAAMTSGGNGIVWKQADAQSLPFEDSCFDAAVCQFGVMFFRDRVKAFREARRVLKPQGVFLFNVWEGLERNGFASVVDDALRARFPNDPPLFLARTPYGQHDRSLYQRQLAEAGFAEMGTETVDGTSRAASAEHVARGFCTGSPLRAEIEARGSSALQDAVEAATRALVSRFGDGPIEAPMQAFVITARRD